MKLFEFETGIDVWQVKFALVYLWQTKKLSLRTFMLGDQELIALKNQAFALFGNVKAWFSVRLLGNSALNVSQERIEKGLSCITINNPGGFEQFQDRQLSSGRGKDDKLTAIPVGYNLGERFKAPLVSIPADMSYDDLFPADTVIVDIGAFSINYADICIRWGLYESALRYVGFPIVPGFDFSGTIRWAGKSSGYSKGEAVFGFSLFGAYSEVVLVPNWQIHRIPQRFGNLSRSTLPNAFTLIAGVPAVAATALHAIAQCKAYPQNLNTNNKACLIHSAAGGVGSMLIQICKLRGFSPVVAVIGSPHKRQYCLDLGADYVIDKSTEDLWAIAEVISSEGYVSIFDANGVETLKSSYDHLSKCGNLITYGFHSNIPKASSFISPFHWIKVVIDLLSMPKFDAMDMVVNSKTVSGFNLSFFADERAIILNYMGQIYEWLESGQLKMLDIKEFEMSSIDKAHEHIQSGRSVGKIMVKTMNQ